MGGRGCREVTNTAADADSVDKIRNPSVASSRGVDERTALQLFYRSPLNFLFKSESPLWVLFPGTAICVLISMSPFAHECATS